METNEAPGANAPPKAKQRLRPPWQKGQSGNPAGSKVGSKHRATVFVESLLSGEADALVRKVHRCIGAIRGKQNQWLTKRPPLHWCNISIRKYLAEALAPERVSPDRRRSRPSATSRKVSQPGWLLALGRQDNLAVKRKGSPLPGSMLLAVAGTVGCSRRSALAGDGTHPRFTFLGVVNLRHG
jgi:hypothetical protein